MFVVLAFPFADVRGFLGATSARLERPSWPLAEPFDDFVRSSGSVRPRPRGGVKEWAGEDLYVDASLALRFPNRLGDIPIGPRASPTSVLKTFRRFYSDGIVAHLDVGFIFANHEHYSSHDWLELLRQTLAIPVRIRNGANQHLETPLIGAGPSLAEHYLQASTNRTLESKGAIERWWFGCGSPLLLVEHASQFEVSKALMTKKVLDDSTAAASVRHAWLEIGAHQYRTWFIARRGIGDTDALRRLRIHLTRLHAERECLRYVLKCAASDKFSLKKDPAKSNAIQRYLLTAVRLLDHRSTFVAGNTGIVDLAKEAIDSALEGQTASLEHMRRQVAARVKDYLNRTSSSAAVVNYFMGDKVNHKIQMGNVSVVGDFNVVTADNIQNSFHKVTNAAIDGDLKARLQELTVEVAKLAKRLPAEAAEVASKDLATLTSEATAKSPRREWCELSAKGLVEAAKAVAEMATPISTAVKAVMALLVP